MNTYSTQSRARTQGTISLGYAIVGGGLLIIVLCAVGISSFFRLSAGPAALLDSMLGGTPGDWKKKFALNAGGLTTGLVRFGLSFAHLKPEAWAAVNSLRGVEVGIYNPAHLPGSFDSASVIAKADKEMAARGWTRAVGVCHEHELVTIYFPRQKSSASGVKCCVMVFDGRQLVVASVRGNFEPLMGILHQRLEGAMNQHLLAALMPAGGGHKGANPDTLQTVADHGEYGSSPVAVMGQCRRAERGIYSASPFEENMRSDFS